MVEIDNLDRKILHCLDKNSRQSASEIAKKLRVHKNVVNFRINKLVKNKVVKQFVAMISPTVLGLIPCKFYLQFQNFTDKKEEHLLKFIQRFPLYWAARTSGRWDFIFGVMVESLEKLNEIKKELIGKFGEDITNKTISILVEAPHYYRNYLSDEKDYKVKYWVKQEKKQEIDETDLKILRILANNSRTPIVEISEKVGANVKTIISRIKNLEKGGVIYDYRISLNLEKMGYEFYKCFISLKSYNEPEYKKLLDYFKEHENIIHVVECVGEWDLEPEFEIESFDKFQKTLREIRNKFSGIVKNIETINILQESSYTCLPD